MQSWRSWHLIFDHCMSRKFASSSADASFRTPTLPSSPWGHPHSAGLLWPLAFSQYYLSDADVRNVDGQASSRRPNIFGWSIWGRRSCCSSWEEALCPTALLLHQGRRDGPASCCCSFNRPALFQVPGAASQGMGAPAAGNFFVPGGAGVSHLRL